MKITKILKVGILAAAIALLMCAVSVFAQESEAPVQNSELNIDYCNLAFGDNMSANILYAVKSADANVKLYVWDENDLNNGGFTAANAEVLSPLAEKANIGGTDYTVFEFDGFGPHQMGDVFYARACIAEGGNITAVGEINKYSVLQYAYNKLGKTGTATENTKLTEWINAALAYGAESQNLASYDTYRLVTAKWYQIKLTGGSIEADGCNNGLYLKGDKVTIVAAEQKDGVPFAYWIDQDGAVAATTATAEISVPSKNKVYTPVYYAGSTTPPAYTEPTIYADKVTAKAGETVSVKIYVANNLEVLSAFISVNFGDGLVFESVTKEKNGVFSNLDGFESTPKDNIKDNTLKLLWDGAETTEADESGVLITLNFTVKEDATGTQNINVTYNAGEIFDFNLAPLEFDTVSGAVIIE